MRKIWALVLAVMLMAPVIAKAELGAEDQRQIARIEAFLNARSSFSARFTQMTEDGNVMTGNLIVKRPGKMNLTYDPPAKDFIIADGSFVYLWDGELGNATTLPLGGSLADFILRAKLKLSGDISVEKVEHGAGRLEITLRQANDPDQGSLTLLFEDQPLLLKGWRITDAQLRSTTVTLQDIQENIQLADSSFVFRSPHLGKNPRQDSPLR
jgi:outer membrane lipoprotein-sorting protein